jgi:pantoate--beta-alanine ligase
VVTDVIRKKMRDHILSFDHTAIDYIEFCDPDTLDSLERVGEKVVVALAVKVGKSRLIDNALMGPG